MKCQTKTTSCTLSIELLTVNDQKDAISVVQVNKMLATVS